MDHQEESNSCLLGWRQLQSVVGTSYHSLHFKFSTFACLCWTCQWNCLRTQTNSNSHAASKLNLCNSCFLGGGFTFVIHSLQLVTSLGGLFAFALLRAAVKEMSTSRMLSADCQSLLALWYCWKKHCNIEYSHWKIYLFIDCFLIFHKKVLKFSKSWVSTINRILAEFQTVAQG